MANPSPKIKRPDVTSEMKAAAWAQANEWRRYMFATKVPTLMLSVQVPMNRAAESPSVRISVLKNRLEASFLSLAGSHAISVAFQPRTIFWPVRSAKRAC